MAAPEIPTDPKTKKYFETINRMVKERYAVAKKAREKGLDYEKFVESIPVRDLGERIETIVGPPGIAERYRKVFKENNGDRMQTIFQIFREIIEQKWFKEEDPGKRLEQGVKTGLVIETEGVVVAPIDGVPKVIISKNPDGSKYVDVYFAGPIRAAGGSSTVLPLILADYGRKLLGLGCYKPTEEEVERYVEEIMIYQNEVISRQYMMTEDEVRIIIRGCPVCINGVPTVEREVSVHRDLERVPSNRIRGGMGLVISEGVALKAMKILKWAKQLELDWSWLEKIIKVSKTTETKIELKPNPKYLDRIAAGRPLLAYPMRYGGFRLRYGRSRNSGIMGKAINPATMYLLDEFIAVGTHIRIERPGKAAQLFPCNSIDGPIILLKDGEVRRVNSPEEAKKIKPMLKKLLFLGDMLVTLGDFRKTAHPLVPSPYVEEWWEQELKKAITEGKKAKGIDLNQVLEDNSGLNGEEAVKISECTGVPLHPRFLHYYTALNEEKTSELIKQARKGNRLLEGKKILGLELKNSEELKESLERIGLPHTINGNKLLVGEEFAFSFLKTLGCLEEKEKPVPLGKGVLEMLSGLSGLKIQDKAGTFVGARMGRPEAAKSRTMKGNPHVLFPIGLAGGATRSINKAMDFAQGPDGFPGRITVEISLFKCPKCGKQTELPFCHSCSTKTTKLFDCPKCKNLSTERKCTRCGTEANSSTKRQIELNKLMQEALKKLGSRLPETVKGVRGLINQDKEAEAIEKGILRAKYDLHVFRDGTMRYELLNAPITHFKPKEIGLSVEKTLELGYEKDIKGNPLASDGQILEIFPQDMIFFEGSSEWLLRACAFIDDLLERFYGVKRFYNAKNKQDLIGELVIGLAPHTSAGIIGRLIGFSKAKVGWAHPYAIMTKRRNCLVGDTPVIVNSRNAIKSIEIGSLDNGSTLEEIPLKDVHTLTVTENGELKREKVNSLLKRKAPKEAIEIRTGFGRKITVTPDHKMLVFENGKIKKKEALLLKKEEKLLSLNKLVVQKETKKISVLEHYLKKTAKEKKKLRVHGTRKKLKVWIEKNGGCWKLARELGCRDGKAIHTAVWFDSVPLDLFEKIIKKMGKTPSEFPNALIGYAKQKAQIPSEVKFSRGLGQLVGYYLADGYSRTDYRKGKKKFFYQVSMVSAEKKITRKMVKAMAEINGTPSIEERNGLEIITLSGRPFYEFFNEVLGTGSNARSKVVSQVLLNAKKEFIKGVLGGYITGDGSIDRNCIKTSSVNKNLTNGMGLLCNRLELFPHFFEQEREIRSGKVKEFYAKKGERKRIHSFGLRIYSNEMKKLQSGLIGEKKAKLSGLLKKLNIKGKRVQRIGAFVLDKIKKINKVKPKTRHVYDLMVEGSKTYIAGFGNLGVYDCDGDQDSIMLLLDALINFSEHYLSGSRGGRMDAPLVFTSTLNPTEIDNEVYEMETTSTYPIEFYEKTIELSSPFLKEIPIVKDKLGNPDQYIGLNYSHETDLFDKGPKQSMYVRLETMEQKVRRQAILQSKIKAIDEKDALERVLNSHFLPDIVGNTRAFSRQTFRCTKCNTRYRRVPLVGKCVKCGGKIILTISKGSVKKYLKIAKQIVNEYQLSDYLKQRLELIEREINSVFENDGVQQKSLSEFV